MHFGVTAGHNFTIMHRIGRGGDFLIHVGIKYAGSCAESQLI